MRMEHAQPNVRKEQRMNTAVLIVPHQVRRLLFSYGVPSRRVQIADTGSAGGTIKGFAAG
jgi:hypothetical protein